MIRLLVCIGGLFSVVTGHSAQAASENGVYGLKGVGRASCAEFVEARNAGKEAYRNHGAWISGYISAVNKLSDDTVDVTTWQSIDIVAAYIANFCSRDDSVKLVDALDAVISALWDDRIKRETHQITAETPSGQVQIYESVLSHVQAELIAQDLMKGGATSTFDKETELALRVFQQQNNLPVSGLPDQRTLYLLLAN